MRFVALVCALMLGSCQSENKELLAEMRELRGSIDTQTQLLETLVQSSKEEKNQAPDQENTVGGTRGIKRVKYDPKEIEELLVEGWVLANCEFVWHPDWDGTKFFCYLTK